MKSFKLFVESQRGDERLFESIFDDLYERGCYSRSFPKSELKETQYRWFKIFKKILETKEFTTIVYLLNEAENNNVTREWFSKLTGYDMARKSSQFVEQVVREYCNIELNKKTILMEWKRYVNMTPEEVEKESSNKQRANYFLSQLRNLTDKCIENVTDDEIMYMAKHLRLLKQVKDSKLPIRNVNGEPTKKLNFLRMLGCDPDII